MNHLTWFSHETMCCVTVFLFGRRLTGCSLPFQLINKLSWQNWAVIAFCLFILGGEVTLASLVIGLNSCVLVLYADRIFSHFVSDWHDSLYLADVQCLNSRRYIRNAPTHVLPSATVTEVKHRFQFWISL